MIGGFSGRFVIGEPGIEGRARLPEAKRKAGDGTSGQVSEKAGRHLGHIARPAEREGCAAGPAASRNDAYIARRMIRISITAAAFEAIASTLPFGSTAFKLELGPTGERFIWLEPRSVDRLAAMRGPDESYSDVILQLAS